MNKQDIYLVGHVKFTDKASDMFYDDTYQASVDFLIKLQDLMEEFGVVKLDISTDDFKYYTIHKNK